MKGWYFSRALRKQMKKTVKIISYVILVAVLALTMDFLIVVTFSFYQPDVEKADAAIVLGAAINTPALYNRSLEGLRLYEEGKADKLVLSGGRISDEDISEAQYMQKVISANSKGAVPSMILEQDSHTTYENINNSRQLIPDAQSVIIVSDGFHLARAVLVAKKAGFKKVYWHSPSPFYYQPQELAFYYAREVAAMISYVPKLVMGKE